MAILPGRKVASGSEDGTIKIWDIETGASLQTIDKCHVSMRECSVVTSTKCACVFEVCTCICSIHTAMYFKSNSFLVAELHQKHHFAS